MIVVSHLWISMDFVDGTDAARLLSGSPGGIAVAEVVDIVDAIADALDFAHQRGLLHRDVKPANILIATADLNRRRILLADFGIGRELEGISGLTATNMTLGTVSYAAPEQLMGEPIDGRTDQYALAATAFHLLTGGPVFDHSNPAVVISRHLNADPPALSDHRAELAPGDAVMRRALAKNPVERFSSCADFAAALRSAMAQSQTDSAHGVTAEPRESDSTPQVSPTAPTQLAPVAPSGGALPPAPDQPSPRRPRARLIGLAAAAIVAVVATAAVVLWPRESRNEPARHSADNMTTPAPSSPAAPPAIALPPEVATAGALRVGTNVPYTPAEFKDTQGRLVGVYSGGILWAPRQGPPINPDDACGLSVAVQATTTEETSELPDRSNKCVAEGKAPIHILSFEGQDQATNALLQGHADAATADSMVTAYMIKVSGGRLVPAGQMSDAAPMGWVVAKGSPLAPSLRQALERLIASGRCTKILDAWGVGAISNPQINAGIS
jgi:ABC-type amino acid transport substrate-binding protein